MKLKKIIYQIMFLLKYFYQKNKFKVPTPKFKINEISNATGIPRETVRRKKVKLIKNKFIMLK